VAAAAGRQTSVSWSITLQTLMSGQHLALPLLLLLLLVPVAARRRNKAKSTLMRKAPPHAANHCNDYIQQHRSPSLNKCPK